MSALTTLRERLKGRTDSEHEQALLRIVIVGLFLGYMATFHGWPGEWSEHERDIVAILSGFFAIATAIFVAICIYPEKNVPRRLIGMLADAGGSTWYLCVAGDYGFFVIAVFLFITFGNGFRYGRRYLFGCQALCLVGLVGGLVFVPYWRERPIPGVGLLIAMVVLPLYVSTLLKRIQEARARAEEANVAKTTFLANMSHEMRTPLNGIVGVVDLFRTTDLTHQQTELVQLLRHSVTVLRSLVDDVLDISKIEAGRLTIEVVSFDLHATVNGLLQLLRPHAKSKGLQLHATIDPELDYRVRGDSHHVRQILLNLLGNAIKFTEAGEVSLSIRRLRESPDGVTVRFDVRDTGIGIPAHVLPRIFERFVQADQSTTRRFGGSGLGTTIAKQLVELMGGNIGVESKINEGSNFWFELPLLKDAEAQVAEPAPLAAPSDRGRCLLIADGPDRSFAMSLLSSAGENIEVCPANEPVGARLDLLLNAAVPLRAVIACCPVDAACTSFLAARQRYAEKRVALVFLAREPLSVIDAARIKSIQEAVVIEKPTTRLVRNAIHAATASTVREGGDTVDLIQLLRTERRSLKILVAEDNATNQAIISQLLHRAGHDVVIASDGEEALDLYEKEAPDLAILDFNMPYRTGIEVIQAIRAMEAPNTRLPAIILSALVTVETRRLAVEAGADAFVGKPFDAAALLQSIDNLAQRFPSLRTPKVAVAKRVERTAAPGTSRGMRTGLEDGELIDAGRIADLEDIARDPSFMAELLRGFKLDVEALLERMDRRLAEHDLAAFPDLNHTLKGAAVGVGARELSNLSDALSRAGYNDEAAVRRIVDDIKVSFARTIASLDRYIRHQHQLSL